jgi:3-methylcrotonyl-CoA carboxylase alpha subunit
MIRSFKFEYEGAESEVKVRYLEKGWTICAFGEHVPVLLKSAHGDALSLQVGTQSIVGTVVRHGERFHVFSQSQHEELNYADPLLHAGETEAEAGRLTAPMPGKIVALLVAAGQPVKKGEPLLIMEAMKMEHTIAAPKDGVVKELMYLIGDQVADGAQLLVFE